VRGEKPVENMAPPPPPAPPVAQELPPAPRVNKTPEFEFTQETPRQEVKPLVRDQLAPPPPQSPTERHLSAPASVSPRREQREMSYDDSAARGFFKRMADVGRVLSGTGRPELGERVHVVQHTQVEAKPQKQAAEDDQYLDIPAFLRRQAN
jgi:hypothetical protein